MALGSIPPLAKATAAAVVLAVIGLAWTAKGSDYEVDVVLDSATSVVEGSPIQVNGFDAGHVETIRVDDGNARLTLVLDDSVAPLHDGAQVAVTWKAVLSERLIEVTDGPEGNAEIPDGGLVPGVMLSPVELDDVLNGLDAETRKELQGLLANLDASFAGRGNDLNQTIKAGGPVLEEFGQLLRALGTDGPAIRHLAERLDEMLGVMAERDTEIQAVVDSLGDLTEDVAAERAGLRKTLQELPAALRDADRALGKVPGAVDEAAPLLGDLAPVTKELGPVSKDLAPLLRDLRPFAADLRPTLQHLHRLLGVTPGLLDTAGATLPGLTAATKDLRKPVAHLRPYTPEITGYFTNWGSAFADWDANGQFARVFVQTGTSAPTENPGVLPPGVTDDPYVPPGGIVGQPWTDAHGSEMQ